MTAELTARDINYMAAAHFELGQEMVAKIRYSHVGEACRVAWVSADGSRVRIRFQQPVRAATPGQAVVFYGQGYVLAGGVICGSTVY